MKCRPFPFDKKIKNCYEIYACRRAAVPASVLAGAAGRTACMFFTVMVMIVVGTYSVRIVIQSSIEIGFYIGIRIALVSAEVTDSYAGQRILSAAADASADEKFYALLAKEHCKRFMTEITGIEDLCPDDFIVLYIVKLKLLRVAEMLKNLTVVICHSDFHNHTSCYQMMFIYPLYLGYEHMSIK